MMSPDSLSEGNNKNKKRSTNDFFTLELSRHFPSRDFSLHDLSRITIFAKRRKLDAKYSCEKNYHTNGRRLSIETRDTRIHRRAILPSAQVWPTLIAPKALLPRGRRRRRGEEAARICGVYKSSSFECSERSSNTYCLLAVAAQLTSLGTPSPSFRLVAKGLKTTGRLGRESNSFPSQSFLTPSSPSVPRF